MNLHSSLHSSLEMKFPKNWVEGAIFKKICRGNQKGEGRGNAKVIGR